MSKPSSFFFNRQNIVQASVLMTFSALAGRVMGFVREVVVAHTFGATQAYDLYLVAILFPTLLATILLYAVPGAFIPVYLKAKHEGGDETAWRFFLHLLHRMGLPLLFLSLAIGLLAPLLTRLYAPGLDPVSFEATVQVFRWVSPVVFLAGVFALLRGVLNAEARFFMPALAPIFLNLMIITAALVLSRPLGTRALGIGLTAGYGLQCASLFFVFFQKNTPYRFGVEGGFHSLEKEYFRLFFFILGVEAMGRMAPLIDRLFMARLSEGGLSALSYADYLCQFPIGVIGYAVGSALFPTLSHRGVNADWRGVRRLFSQGIQTLALVTVPIGVVFLLFAPQLIQIVYQRGAFDARATQMTAAVLRALGIGFWSYVFLAVVIRTQYALGMRRGLLIAGVCGFATKMLLSCFLVSLWREVGLALATSLAGIIHLTVATRFLQRRLGGLEGRETMKRLFKALLLSFGCYGLGYGVFQMSPPGPLAFLLGAGIGTGTYLAGLHLFHLMAWQDLVSRLRGRV